MTANFFLSESMRRALINSDENHTATVRIDDGTGGTGLRPHQDTTKWVDQQNKVSLISELDTNHIKNILAGFNMGERYSHQVHKKEALLTEYKKRKHD